MQTDWWVMVVSYLIAAAGGYVICLLRVESMVRTAHASLDEQLRKANTIREAYTEVELIVRTHRLLTEHRETLKEMGEMYDDLIKRYNEILQITARTIVPKGGVQ